MEKNLGNTIKNIRLQRGMSLRKFSECVGISHSYVNKLENNPDIQNQATIETLLKISQALQIPFGDFLYICGYFDKKLEVGKIPVDDSLSKNNVDVKYHLNKFISILKNADTLTYGENIFEKKSADIIIQSLKVGIEMAKQNSRKKIKPRR